MFTNLFIFYIYSSLAFSVGAGSKPCKDQILDCPLYAEDCNFMDELCPETCNLCHHSESTTEPNAEFEGITETPEPNYSVTEKQSLEDPELDDQEPQTDSTDDIDDHDLLVESIAGLIQSHLDPKPSAKIELFPDQEIEVILQKMKSLSSNSESFKQRILDENEDKFLTYIFHKAGNFGREKLKEMIDILREFYHARTNKAFVEYIYHYFTGHLPALKTEDSLSADEIRQRFVDGVITYDRRDRLNRNSFI